MIIEWKPKSKTRCTVLSIFSATLIRSLNTLWDHVNWKFPRWQHSICDISQVELTMKIRLLSNGSDKIIVQLIASVWMQTPETPSRWPHDWSNLAPSWSCWLLWSPCCGTENHPRQTPPHRSLHELLWRLARQSRRAAQPSWLAHATSWSRPRGSLLRSPRHERSNTLEKKRLISKVDLFASTKGSPPVAVHSNMRCCHLTWST